MAYGRAYCTACDTLPLALIVFRKMLIIARVVVKFFFFALVFVG